MARDEALIAELLTGGNNWIIGRWERLPPEARADHWLADSPPRTQEWEALYVRSGGHSPGIHGEALPFLSAASGVDLRGSNDWRWAVLAVDGADAGVVSMAMHWECASNGGTYDARTGRCVMPGQPPVEPPTEPPVEPPVEPPEPEPVDPYVLRLQGGRFEARVEFATDEENDSESAHPVPLSQFGDAGGAFWFFSPDNPELFVKVVGPVRGKYWVFAAALSDVAFTLAVDDTKTGAVRFYKNNAGQFTGLARDTEAFEA